MTDLTSGRDRQIFGKLGSVSLNDIIQLLGMSKRTATLELRRGETRGRLYFRDGQIVHATAGPYEGEESYIELLGWADAEFAIEEGIHALPKVSITKSTEALMLSTMTTLDEIERLRGKVPVRVSPSITKKRRLPRPRRATQHSSSRRKWLTRAAFTVLAASLTSAAVGWVWLVPSELDAPLRQLPTVASPPSPRLSASSATSLEDAWTIATTIAQRPARAVQAPPPTTTTTTPQVLSPGYITIVVDPWARIEIDGASVGETPLGKLELAAGTHRMTLINDHIVGHIQDEIVVEAGVSRIERYSFGDVGYLRLVATPWANVSVDGRLVGQTPLASIAVPAGMHSVLFAHPDLGEAVREIAVVSGQTTLVRVQLQ